MKNIMCVACGFIAYAAAADCKAEVDLNTSFIADEAWYVPGWMRTNEPEELAWNSFTNVFSITENRFHKWDGNQLWPTAAKNADAEAVKLASYKTKIEALHKIS